MKIGASTSSANKAATRNAWSLSARSEKNSTRPVRKMVMSSVASEPSTWT